MKIVVFLKNDFIGSIAYNAGEICGWPDHIADRLIAKDFAKLYGGDGKPKVIDGKIPGAEDFWTDPKLAEHVAQLKKEGKWTPAPPVVVMDPEVQRAARERARAEQNQI
jgi:hypothetical protein